MILRLASIARAARLNRSASQKALFCTSYRTPDPKMFSIDKFNESKSELLSFAATNGQGVMDDFLRSKVASLLKTEDVLKLFEIQSTVKKYQRIDLMRHCYQFSSIMSDGFTTFSSSQAAIIIKHILENPTNLKQHHLLVTSTLVCLSPKSYFSPTDVDQCFGLIQYNADYTEDLISFLINQLKAYPTEFKPVDYVNLISNFPWAYSDLYSNLLQALHDRLTTQPVKFTHAQIAKILESFASSNEVSRSTMLWMSDLRSSFQHTMSLSQFQVFLIAKSLDHCSRISPNMDSMITKYLQTMAPFLNKSLSPFEPGVIAKLMRCLRHCDSKALADSVLTTLKKRLPTEADGFSTNLILESLSGFKGLNNYKSRCVSNLLPFFKHELLLSTGEADAMLLAEAIEAMQYMTQTEADVEDILASLCQKLESCPSLSHQAVSLCLAGLQDKFQHVPPVSRMIEILHSKYSDSTPMTSNEIVHAMSCLQLPRDTFQNWGPTQELLKEMMLKLFAACEEPFNLEQFVTLYKATADLRSNSRGKELLLSLDNKFHQWLQSLYDELIFKNESIGTARLMSLLSILKLFPTGMPLYSFIPKDIALFLVELMDRSPSSEFPVETLGAVAECVGRSSCNFNVRLLLMQKVTFKLKDQPKELSLQEVLPFLIGLQGFGTESRVIRQLLMVLVSSLNTNVESVSIHDVENLICGLSEKSLELSEVRLLCTKVISLTKSCPDSFNHAASVENILDVLHRLPTADALTQDLLAVVIPKIISGNILWRARRLSLALGGMRYMDLKDPNVLRLFDHLVRHLSLNKSQWEPELVCDALLGLNKMEYNSSSEQALQLLTAKLKSSTCPLSDVSLWRAMTSTQSMNACVTAVRDLLLFLVPHIDNISEPRAALLSSLTRSMYRIQPDDELGAVVEAIARAYSRLPSETHFTSSQIARTFIGIQNMSPDAESTRQLLAAMTPFVVRMEGFESSADAAAVIYSLNKLNVDFPELKEIFEVLPSKLCRVAVSTKVFNRVMSGLQSMNISDPYVESVLRWLLDCGIPKIDAVGMEAGFRLLKTVSEELSEDTDAFFESFVVGLHEIAVELEAKGFSYALYTHLNLDVNDREVIVLLKSASRQVLALTPDIDEESKHHLKKTLLALAKKIDSGMLNPPTF